MTEHHDTVRIHDTVRVNNTVRLWSKGDTVYRDSIRTVYVSKDSDSRSNAKATADSSANASNDIVTEKVVERVPWVMWVVLGAMAAVTLIALAAAFINKIRRKTN